MDIDKELEELFNDPLLEVSEEEARLFDMPEDMKLWSPDSPFLYDLRVRMTRRYRVVDEFTSYFGMRELGKKMIDGVMRPTINGKFVFQNGTLDQGYWPDGNLRAPTDEALKSDIVKHKQLGFNLIRKHIKVEPQRWFYWCDRIGMLVWQDMPSMHTHAVASRDAKKRRSFHPNAAEKARFEGELKEMIDEHISSPSVVCWILFNEGWGIYEKEEVKRLADWVSRYDPSRWLNDSTGLPNGHAAGDVYDVHIYKGPSAGVSEKSCFSALGEWGGVGLNVRGHTWFERGGWSYDTTKGNAQLNERYLKMQDELLNNMYFPGLSAAMYTQISDVEGETNGILTYDRKVCKFDEAALTAKHDRLICESKNLKKVTDAIDYIKGKQYDVMFYGEDLNGWYRAKVQLADSSWVFTCEEFFDLRTDSLELIAYPTPAPVGQPVTIKAMGILLEKLVGSRLTITNVQGVTIKEFTLEQNQRSVDVELSAGLYIATLVTGDADDRARTANVKFTVF